MPQLTLKPKYTNSNKNNAQYNERRAALKAIADGTLSALQRGYYELGGVRYPLDRPTEAAKTKTKYYDPDSLLSAWEKEPPAQPSSTTVVGSSGSASTPTPHASPYFSGGSTTGNANANAQAQQPPETEFTILEISTLEGARYIADTPSPHTPNTPSSSTKIGILNFASATKPGGGFLTGAQAQEESIARSSNLYHTLMTPSSQRFYTLHSRDSKGGYYTHAMIYSPNVLVFRTDDGGWTEPLAVDVLTSPAVNAGVVRKTAFGAISPKQTDQRIEKVMKARMGRILYLFEQEGVKNLVLGSFGTGVFQNKVEVVARLWAELIGVKGARFEKSFERVVFAILGRETVTEFERVWNEVRGTVEMEEDHESDMEV
ncbi:hypothetical protein AX16_006196 [Volvariella volvacea WC 439]|nr:hypothetical protein AX16_006196 [Volvariella volvacea WC 439]